jgi:hypothetical protein
MRSEIQPAKDPKCTVRVLLTAAVVLTALRAATLPSYAGQMITEQQARVAVAQFVQGPMFACVDKRAPPYTHADYAQCMADIKAADPDIKPVTAAKTEEILSHIRESLLVVSGDTHYCGVIREPTWILMWDSAEVANTLFGGYPVMIDARTGKVRDCRS